MSNEVFYFEPFHDNRIIDENYKILTTTFENDVEQRRAKTSRSRLRMTYSFDRILHDNVDDVWDFYKDRKGPYDSFFVPVWEYVSYLTQTANGSAIYVDDRSLFSPTAGVRGNYIFMRKIEDPVKFDVMKIDSFGATAGMLYLSGNVTYNYAINTDVFVTSKARFLTEIYSKKYLSKIINHVDLDFIEVFE